MQTTDHLQTGSNSLGWIQRIQTFAMASRKSSSQNHKTSKTLMVLRHLLPSEIYHQCAVLRCAAKPWNSSVSCGWVFCWAFYFGLGCSFIFILWHKFLVLLNLNSMYSLYLQLWECPARTHISTLRFAEHPYAFPFLSTFLFPITETTSRNNVSQRDLWLFW